MVGLLIETSGPSAWIACCRQRLITQVIHLPSPQDLSLHLHQALDHLLTDNGINQVEYIAVGKGPGSYAGSRTAMTVAITLQFALQIPIITFPSHLGFLPDSFLGKFAYIADAKMGQLALFKGIETKDRVQLSPFTLIAKEELAAYLLDVDLIVSGISWLQKDYQSKPVFTPIANPTRVAAFSYEKHLSRIYSDANELRIIYYR